MPQDLAIEGGAPVRPQMLIFGAPVLGDEEHNEVLDTLRSGWIGTGPKTVSFEAEFARYVGATHAISMNSCTAGLHLSLVAAGVGEGDEVITSPLTFAATANVIVHQGAIPVFADIDDNTLNIDPVAVERAITTRTKAIIAVHFGGLPCDLGKLRRIADAHALALIEDAAHAVGATHQGIPIGGFGNLTCFSFYANKNMTTAEGGMVTTNNERHAELLSTYRLHGLSRDAWKRFHSDKLILSEAVAPGYKYNMTDLQSSLGIHQLRKLDRFLTIRERYAAVYDEAFATLPGVRRQVRQTDDGTRHGLHLYVLILDPAAFRVARNDIVSALLAENIGAAIHYRALHTHPYYRERFSHAPEDFPRAATIGENIMSLPLTPGMKECDIQDVIVGVHKVLRHYRR